MAATMHCGETRELSKRGLDILVLKNEFSSWQEDLEATRPLLAFARGLFGNGNKHNHGRGLVES